MQLLIFPFSYFPLNTNLQGFSPILDETGKITGYKTTAGADTVFPFNSNDLTMGEWGDDCPPSGSFTANADGIVNCFSLLGQSIPTWYIDDIALSHGDGRYSYLWSGGEYMCLVAFKKGKKYLGMDLMLPSDGVLVTIRNRVGFLNYFWF